MNICINTLAINSMNYGGGEKYLYYLIKNLAKIDKRNVYYIIVNAKFVKHFYVSNKNFHFIELGKYTNRLKRVLFEQIMLKNIVKKYKIDVFHGPNNIIPLNLQCKTVLTNQYMYSYIVPEDYKPFYRRWYLNILMKMSAKKADKIISVSKSNKSQIQKYFGIPGDKIEVIYHGIDKVFKGKKRDRHIINKLKKHNIDEYILFVGNNVLNKNIDNIIKAYQYIESKYNVSHKLLIAGNIGFLSARRSWLENILRNDKNIIHIGYIENKMLPVLYSKASVFVLPSFCESFGIPLIEAMAVGVPIVTSNVFAMPEVTGNAALKVDPNNYRSIGNAIYRILSNEEIKKTLVKRGKKRISMFSWENAARETLDVYQIVYKRND